MSEASNQPDYLSCPTCGQLHFGDEASTIEEVVCSKCGATIPADQITPFDFETSPAPATVVQSPVPDEETSQKIPFVEAPSVQRKIAAYDTDGWPVWMIWWGQGIGLLIGLIFAVAGPHVNEILDARRIWAFPVCVALGGLLGHLIFSLYRQKAQANDESYVPHLMAGVYIAVILLFGPRAYVYTFNTYKDRYYHYGNNNSRRLFIKYDHIPLRDWKKVPQRAEENRKRRQPAYINE